MSSRPDLRPIAVFIGTLLGVVALGALAHVGMRTQFAMPLSAAAAACAWFLFAPFRRRFGVLDANAAQMSATAWVAALPAALLVVPWVVRHGGAAEGLLPLALLALAAALLGNATAAVLKPWARGPEALPFPLGQAVAEVIEAPRRRGLSFAALCCGGVFGAVGAIFLGGWWPVASRASWGFAADADLARALGADAATQASFALSSGVLAVGIFLGARGLLLAAAAALAGAVWVPQALDRGWASFPAEARAWLAPLALGLLVGAAAGALLGRLRFASAEGGKRWLTWSCAVAVGIAACTVAIRLVPRTTPIRAAWRVADTGVHATFVVEYFDPARGGAADVVTGSSQTEFVGEIRSRREADPVRIALAGGTTAELRLYPSEVAGASAPLEVGRHFSLKPEALRTSGQFLVFAREPARIYEQDELELVALDRVLSFRAGESFRRGFHALPPAPGIPDDAAFFFMGGPPVETEALRPLAKWWTCVLGRRLPPAVRAELVRPPALPIEHPARVRDDEGVVLRMLHEREGRTTVLAEIGVGKGYTLWSPIDVPANAAAGTAAFRVLCGPGAVPANAASQPFTDVLREWEGTRFVPLDKGLLGAAPGVELGIYRELPFRAGRFDRPLEGTVVHLDAVSWSDSQRTAVVLELPAVRVRAGEVLERVRALAPVPPHLELGVRLVEVRAADGAGWEDAFEIVLRRRGASEGAELARALVETAAAQDVPLAWRDDDGVERRAVLHRSAGALFAGRYPSGRSGEAQLKFSLAGLRCVALEDGELFGEPSPKLRVEWRRPSPYQRILCRVSIDPDGGWKAIGVEGQPFVRADVARLDPASLGFGSAIAVRDLAVLRPEESLRLVHERSLTGVETGVLHVADAKGRAIAVSPEMSLETPVRLGADLCVVLPADARTPPPPSSLVPALRAALVLCAIACFAAVVSMLMAGVGEVLPWSVFGAFLVASLAQVWAGFLWPMLAAFVALVAAAHAADLGRDLRTGGIVGASAHRQIGLKIGLSLIAPLVAVLVVGWIALEFPWLGAPQARSYEALASSTARVPELYFSPPRLGAGALAGGAAALVGFPGLGVLVGLGLLLPQAIAFTLGAGALLRVVAERLFARGDVRAWLLPFAAGLLLGEALCAFAAAAWLEARLLGA